MRLFKSIIVILFFFFFFFLAFPIKNIIPELNTFGFLFIVIPVAIGVIFLINSILIVICFSDIKRRVVLILTIAISSYGYFYLYMQNFTYSNVEIKEKVIVARGDFYRLKKRSLFGSLAVDEIGFSNNYSFLYKTYYSSENHLVIKEANDSSITISEYAISYEWDTSSNRLIPKRGDMIKSNIKDTIIYIDNF